MPNRFLVLLVSVVCLTLAIGVIGCSDYDDDNGVTPTPEYAKVRVQHLFPAAGGVDVYATPIVTNSRSAQDGAEAAEVLADPIKVFENIDYLESSAFANVSPGEYKIDVTLTGDPIDQAVLTIPSLEFTKDIYYTAVAWDDGQGIAALALADDVTDPGANTIRVRAIHAANAVGQVDIWNVTDPNNPIPIWVDLDTGTAGEYFEVPNEAATLGFDVNNDQLVDAFFEVPALPEGTILNAFATLDGSGSLFMHAQFQDGTTVSIQPSETSLRLVHGSPTAGDVDIWANAAVKLADTFQFTDGLPPATVASGTYDIQVTAVGGDPQAPLLEFTDVTLAPGALTVAAYDDGAPTILPAPDDLSAPATGKFRVRAIHIADGIGQVDIWETSGPTPLWVDLDFAAYGDYLELDAGQYNIGIDVDDDATPDVTFSLPSLPAGEVINVFAINDGGTVFLLAQLLDGTTARIDAD